MSSAGTGMPHQDIALRVTTYNPSILAVQADAIDHLAVLVHPEVGSTGHGDGRSSNPALCNDCSERQQRPAESAVGERKSGIGDGGSGRSGRAGENVTMWKSKGSALHSQPVRHRGHGGALTQPSDRCIFESASFIPSSHFVWDERSRALACATAHPPPSGSASLAVADHGNSSQSLPHCTRHGNNFGIVQVTMFKTRAQLAQ